MIINPCDRGGQKQAAEEWRPGTETDNELPEVLDGERREYSKGLSTVLLSEMECD